MMKILILSVGDRFAASTLYRFRQYEAALQNQGAVLEWISQKEFTLHDLEKVAQADLVINQKCLFPLSLSRKIRKLSRRLLFDFDDAIYTRPGKPYGWLAQWRVHSRLRFWLKQADLVIPANHHLARYAHAYSSHVQVVPMGLNLEVWKPFPKNLSAPLVIGWAGAPGNVHHLERLDPILSPLLKKYPEVKLAVYCGKRPTLTSPFEYTPFAPGTEPSFVQQLDIGLLPLTDEPFTHGKSPIKALQYLACEVPVVGNFFGATREILHGDNSLEVQHSSDWPHALETLLQHPRKVRELGKNGRRFVEQHHNKNALFHTLWRLFNDVKNI